MNNKIEEDKNYELTQSQCDPCSVQRNEKINWKGLYEDSKNAWKALLGIILLFSYGLLEVSASGLFSETTIETEVVKINIIEVKKELFNKVIIEGEFVNNPNNPVSFKEKKILELNLPYLCKLQSGLIKKDIYINVYTKYANYNRNNLYHDFSDINKICEKK